MECVKYVQNNQIICMYINVGNRKNMQRKKKQQQQQPYINFWACDLHSYLVLK